MMTPDSTQSDTKGSTKTTVSKRKSPPSSGGDGKAAHGSKQAEAKKKPKVATKTKKPKVKKKSKKSSSPHTEDRERLENDEDAEWMDLSLDLQSIGAYIKNRDQMLDEMFKTIKGEKLKSMLPEVMKKCTLEELRTLCLDQLEVMSKKRIQHILAGEEMTSSSDTDDTTDEDDTRCSKREASSSMLESSAVVDSTCTPTETQEDVDPGAAGELSGVTAKSSGENTPALSLSPDHSELDNLFSENKHERGSVNIEEATTRDDNNKTATADQQYPSNAEETSDRLELKVQPDNDIADCEGTENMQDDIDKTVNSIIGSSSVDQPKPPAPQVTTEGGDDDVTVPTKTQMEILELELRARAIKALMKQQEQRERADPDATS
ncbi:caspase activity and apoptosis inhibitor 1-like isoform X1 [Branchiostoma floridae]|uniref:Caspase activity and apoptosis inhibitor 1-like isoform X1 n=1 Tax=Branchiostoma floridae TaxID=7739 RepID=A0A9J7MFQ2_BRAFL|nr:caspase activity and apoptosis inhibitor 1-like isoform X1 [Branchiostoma floridae]